MRTLQRVFAQAGRWKSQARVICVKEKPIADSANCNETMGLATKRLANCDDVSLESVLLDYGVWPNRSEQFVLGDDLAFGLGQDG